jgi:hypothetical protein
MPPLVVAAIDPSDSAGGQLERRLVEQKFIPRLMRYGCGRLSGSWHRRLITDVECTRVRED